MQTVGLNKAEVDALRLVDANVIHNDIAREESDWLIEWVKRSIGDTEVVKKADLGVHRSSTPDALINSYRRKAARSTTTLKRSLNMRAVELAVQSVAEYDPFFSEKDFLVHVRSSQERHIELYIPILLPARSLSFDRLSDVEKEYTKRMNVLYRYSRRLQRLCILEQIPVRLSLTVSTLGADLHKSSFPEYDGLYVKTAVLRMEQVVHGKTPGVASAHLPDKRSLKQTNVGAHIDSTLSEKLFSSGDCDLSGLRRTNSIAGAVSAISEDFVRPYISSGIVLYLKEIQQVVKTLNRVKLTPLFESLSND